MLRTLLSSGKKATVINPANNYLDVPMAAAKWSSLHEESVSVNKKVKNVLEVFLAKL
jgi:hypothetical protein